MLHERWRTGWRDSKKRVWGVCMRDPVADDHRNWMLIKLLICKGCSEASPVKWDCLEIHGMERRCRLTYEPGTGCYGARERLGFAPAGGGLYFHSDRGSQYSSQAVRKPLSI